MNLKNKTAAGLLYFISLVCIIASMVYLFTPSILPYHVKFLGRTHGQIEPKTAALLIFAFKIIGGCTLSIGIVLAILVKHLFSGQEWIRGTIFIMMTIMAAACEYVMLNVGLYSPWWIVLILYIMLCTALLMAGTEKDLR